MNTAYTFAGFLVGGVVGLTGLGGGSLMTPVLVLLFGYAPQTAIGTGVLGGMATATFLAIFFVPLFFVGVVQLFGRKKGVRAQRPDTDAASPSEAQ